MSEETLTAYCMKCRAKREMTAPQAIYTSKGAPATAGICAVCGTRLFKMGLTPAHANCAQAATCACGASLHNPHSAASQEQIWKARLHAKACRHRAS